jgi:hypothetical protein
VSFADWLAEGAYVDRHVNMFYFLVITVISLCVLTYAVRSRNNRAIRIYLFSLPVWAGIEGFGLVTGMRVYESYQPAVFFFVAFMEDAGWVTLAFIVSEKLFRWRFPKRK